MRGRRNIFLTNILNRQFLLSKANDFWFSIIFGLTAFLFSFIKIEILSPGNAYSDLYEIPLLVSLLYLRNPIWIMVVNLLGILGLAQESIFLPTFLMHIIPQWVLWHYFRWFLNKKFNSFSVGMLSIAGICFYYFGLLFPFFILSYQVADLVNGQPFISFYSELAVSAKYEIVVTTLVVSLYVVQFEVQARLEFTNKNLETIVNERTQELRDANENLLLTNEEVRSLNENLENLVKQRTEKVNHHLQLLNKYAHMNSHELRAPLARVLGLLDLLKIETSEQMKIELIDKLHASGDELDNVVRRMNGLLAEGQNEPFVIGYSPTQFLSKDRSL